MRISRQCADYDGPADALLRHADKAEADVLDEHAAILLNVDVAFAAHQEQHTVIAEVAIPVDHFVVGPQRVVLARASRPTSG